MTVHCDNKGNQFFIEIVPDITEKGKWTGMFQLVINARKTNIDDDSFYQVEQLCQMGCAALSLMEEDKALRDKIYDFMESPSEPANSNMPTKATVHDVSGNVITLKFDKGVEH
tara:strand:+ start:291 stop:629 length:339 start_codon:yes stop_codon:yes gene_type:complete